MKTRLYIILLCVLPLTSFAQESTSFANDSYLDNYKFQVPQIGEFMSRINGDVSIVDKGDTLSREETLLTLFHKETCLRDTVTTRAFIEKVIESSPKIHFEDNSWCALVTCVVVNNKGIEDKVYLILKTQQRGPYMYKWVISDAFGRMLELDPKKSNPGLMISPADNEIDFPSLSFITKKESTNIVNYLSNNCEVSALSVFLTLVYNHIITIKYVAGIQYIFDDIAGYRLFVDRYTGTSKNAGWLISDIQKLHE